MYCNHCSQQIPDDSRFCPRCGQTIASAAAGVAGVPSTSSGLNTMPAPPIPGQEPQTSGKAIASLVLGFLGFILPAAIAAIVLGHISRAEIRRSQGRLRGNGMALGGLILGYLGMAVIPILIIAAIAIPNLLRARMAANEASAVSALRVIATAQQTYSAQLPTRGFACDLATLGPGADGASGSSKANLIDATLARGIKNGYRFRITHCAPGNGVVTQYRATASPVVAGNTGNRSFCVDETGSIRFSRDATTECDKNSPAFE
jgi:type IV pilus assembly protein PilA